VEIEEQQEIRMPETRSSSRKTRYRKEGKDYDSKTVKENKGSQTNVKARSNEEEEEVVLPVQQQTIGEWNATQVRTLIDFQPVTCLSQPIHLVKSWFPLKEMNDLFTKRIKKYNEKGELISGSSDLRVTMTFGNSNSISKCCYGGNNESFEDDLSSFYDHFLFQMRRNQLCH
jgi:hypothetical protein